jgi:hypothetical protein
MKKINILIALVLVFTLGIIACNKQEAYEEKIDKNSNTRQAIGEKIALHDKTEQTPGQIHNELVDAYRAQYTITPQSTPLTYNQVRIITLRSIQIAMEQGIIETGDIEEATEEAMADMIAWGYFNSNQTLKTIHEINAINIAMIPHAGIRDALTDIKNYSGTSNSFLTFANARLAALTGLSTANQKIVDGTGDVLNNSYELWKMSTEQREVFISTADALGMSVGMLHALAKGWDDRTSSMYATYMSFKMSMMAFYYSA